MYTWYAIWKNNVLSIAEVLHNSNYVIIIITETENKGSILYYNIVIMLLCVELFI